MLGLTVGAFTAAGIKGKDIGMAETISFVGLELQFLHTKDNTTEVSMYSR